MKARILIEMFEDDKDEWGRPRPFYSSAVQVSGLTMKHAAIGCAEILKLEAGKAIDTLLAHGDVVEALKRA